ncbi:uncharacterized protein ALTATR162_LOCUS10948 [Alternaria atra]|uniref:Uncharacterized protein n=1 Tax=Alternaria atra TaxID=119953 RepID=A0A8J2IAF0_9PLEO|nr:uncharacterized protein ALTATR162_LOCUS10948 [Alternaria atra]CAG5184516.1 unnamed protein product [Alternaria atra]
MSNQSQSASSGPSTHQSRQQQWHPLPSYHLKAPYGWINDPCAPSYDAATGTYHVYYQWNPKSCDWGNIAWGHATSKDGLRWVQSPGTNPSLQPDQLYDKEGVFTGCLWPTGPYGEPQQLSVFYSSITNLPIHWSLPYIRDSEGLALATSKDGGLSWEKSGLNPILRGEPEGINVTGFRDPFLAEWPAMDEVRAVAGGDAKRSLYGILSGGILGKGPTVFLYAVSPDDLTAWEYLGLLVDMADGLRVPGPWTGEFGVNWECVNFMTLAAEDGTNHKRNFLLMGAEGFKPGYQDAHQTVGLWMAGTLSAVPAERGSITTPKMIHDFGGILDHGALYAPSSFVHPVTRKRILMGWIKEEELTSARRHAKGWTGHLAIPRELFLYTTPSNVTKALRSSLEDVRSMKLIDKRPSSQGHIRHTHALQTLGVRPFSGVRSLAQTAPMVWEDISSDHGAAAAGSRLLDETPSTSWELEAVINVDSSHGRIGFSICQPSRDGAHDSFQGTDIFFDAEREQIVVDKTQSNLEEDIAKDILHGSFTLFYHEQPSTSASPIEQLEKLRLRIFRDGDTLEVFANDRFTLATTVYVDTTCRAIRCFAEGVTAPTAFESIRLWDYAVGAQKSVSVL